VNSNWKECRLGEVAEITSSKRIYYSEYVANGVPFFRSKEIIERFNKQNTSTELFIKRERYEEIKLKFGAPQEGDMLLTSVGTLGIPYLVRKEDEFYFKDGNLTWFRNIDIKAIDRRFLYFWITSVVGQQKLYEASIGSTQPALTIVGLKNIDILLPSFPEQRAIAGVLGSLDDKIDLLHRQNKTLKGMAEALWRKMFVEDSKNLKIVNLGEIIEIHDSKRIPLSSMQREKMKDGVLYPYYGAATVMDYVNQYIFDGEYLLLGEDGTVETDGGYPVLQLATGKFWVNNHTHVLRAKKPFSNFLLGSSLKCMGNPIQDMIEIRHQTM